MTGFGLVTLVTNWFDDLARTVTLKRADGRHGNMATPSGNSQHRRP